MADLNESFVYAIVMKLKISLGKYKCDIFTTETLILWNYATTGQLNLFVELVESRALIGSSNSKVGVLSKITW